MCQAFLLHVKDKMLSSTRMASADFLEREEFILLFYAVLDNVVTGNLKYLSSKIFPGADYLSFFSLVTTLV